MKVICFSGNLGNQIFYCAFKDYLKRKYDMQNVYYHVMKYCPPVMVTNYFELELPKSNWFVDFLSTLVFYSEIALKKLFHQKLSQKLLCGNGVITEESMFFSNYLQDKYYYEAMDSSWLKIKMPDHLSDDYLEFESLIKDHKSICVHIRRGDYVKKGSLYEDLSSTDYYDNAIKYALNIVPEAKIFFFSDDLEYVRSHFVYSNSYYVDCNRGDLSYLDIKLMSLCNINIMANSTFSYWGSYINHEKKIVIYPQRWFKESSGRKSPNIMLQRENWIGL